MRILGGMLTQLAPYWAGVGYKREGVKMITRCANKIRDEPDKSAYP